MSDRNQDNNFAYKTQETQSISELRRQLNEILRELINQEFTNKETGLTATIKQDDIDKISSRKAIVKSNDNGFTKEEHFEVAKDIAPLYENATLKETHSDYKQNPNFANVHRFTIDIEVNGKDTIAKITAFEKIKGDNRIYTIELQGLNPLPYSPRMQEAEVAKSLSQDGTLAYTSDPLIANFDNKRLSQQSLKNQGIKPESKAKSKLRR